MDTIMWQVSSAPFWIPFYVLLLVLLLQKKWSVNHIENLKQFGIIVVTISIAILLADQTSSGFFKPFFERFRPSHSPELEGIIHLLTEPNGSIYKGGSYGFVSSHAANSFAIAWFTASILKSKPIWILMIFWAVMVSYSRIYLGVHYPGDIMGGTIIGILSGAIAAKLYFYLNSKWTD
jgi:undecaprenyl-diphosphatase